MTCWAWTWRVACARTVIVLFYAVAEGGSHEPSQ
jgi:hypothetical protein